MTQTVSHYEVRDYKTCKIDSEGNLIIMANFAAEIIEETRYTDGKNSETILTVVGKMPLGNASVTQAPASPITIEEQAADGIGDAAEQDWIDLPAAKVPASQFHTMAWVLQNWGVRAVLSAGGGHKEDMRVAIQQMSHPVITNVYRHTGWAQIGSAWKYLHVGGAIGAAGNDPAVQVQLPEELSFFDLTQDPEVKVKDAVEAMLALAQVPPKAIGWTLLAAALTPILGPVDFAVHVTGRTGTFKSEVLSLFQSLYGAEMDARHLPGSWSSTPNALEAQCYLAKDAVFVIDDFVPQGSSWQQRLYQVNADKIVRAQGNQAGRARLTDVSNLQTTMYPRGVVFSTGEDTPEGHSVRARMVIMELSPGDIDTAMLTKAQKARELLPNATAAFIQWCAKHPDVDWKSVAEAMRTQHLDVGHSRTPSMIGRLAATANVVCNWLIDAKLLTPGRAGKLAQEWTAAIVATAGTQKEFLESADPCEVFLATIKHILGAGLGHLRTKSGGIPKGATLLGWTKERSEDSEFPVYKSHGPTIGWIDWKANEIYIDGTSGLNIIKKVAGAEIPLTRQTLLKRLRDSGHLTRTDDARSRNTIRIQAEDHSRQVLALAITAIIDSGEKPNAQDEERGEEG